MLVAQKQKWKDEFCAVYCNKIVQIKNCSYISESATLNEFREVGYSQQLLGVAHSMQ